MQDATLQEFVKELSAKQATPGAGATTASMASMAVATILKAVRFSEVKTLTPKNKQLIQTTIGELESIRDEFLQYIEEDHEGFISLSEAYKMPSETISEKKAKEKSVQIGLQKAAHVPQKIIQKVRQVQLMVEKVYPLIKQNLISDIGVGLEMLRSAAHSASYIIYSNIKFLKNKPKKLQMTTSVETKIASIDKLTKLLMKSIKSVII